jgi:hypothetical protein
MLNPKLETLNSKQTQMSKEQNSTSPAPSLARRGLRGGEFGFRYPDLEFLPALLGG